MSCWIDVVAPWAVEFTPRMQKLYRLASMNPLPGGLGVMPERMRGMVQLAWQGDGTARPYWAVWEPQEPLEVPCSNDAEILIGFTGGKDSLACALEARRHGMEPVLVQLVGLNRGYPAEAGAARQLADRLGMELVQVPCRQRGTNAWPDNHVKNQLVLAVLTDLGLVRGIRWVTVGDQSEITSMAASAYGYDWSDTVEMIAAYNDWATARWPAYRWRYLLRNYTDSYRIIYESDPALLGMTRSCISPHRFVEHWRQGNERKYGVQLPAGRCGSCYKCAMEWLNWRALGGAQANAGYLRHCLDVLRRQWTRMYAVHTVPRNDTEVIEQHVDPRQVDATVLGWRRADSRLLP